MERLGTKRVQSSSIKSWVLVQDQESQEKGEETKSYIQQDLDDEGKEESLSQGRVYRQKAGEDTTEDLSVVDPF